ncbi:outer membrane beta-barrel protein [Helicobacter baculiformis]|uniref:Outer membrane beta-barrel protein n=1 Tax=Helicobacter baculiformis TaxID=427351 RepID=A0ABV7ZJ78_9HELI|nr:outer membrane beta-barrel protein [Helicobacter baculiformis]
MKHLRSLVLAFVFLHVLYGGDVRNGFFVGGRFGVSNRTLSSRNANPTSIQQKQIYKPVAVAGLVKGLDKNLQEALQTLQSLNKLIAQTKDGNQTFKDLSQISLSGLDGMSALQEKIATAIQELGAIIDISAEKAQDQGVLSQYSALLNTLNGLQKDLIQEVDSYNQALNSQEQNYIAAHVAYEKAMGVYESNMQNYTKAYDSLTSALNSASSASDILKSAPIITKDLSALMQADPAFTQTQYNADMQTGISHIISGQDLSQKVGTQNPDTFFLQILKSIDPDFPYANLNQLVALAYWFEGQASVIKGLPDSSSFMSGLLNAYDGFFQVVGEVGGWNSVIPSASSVFSKPQFTTPDTLSFNYKDFSQQIQTAMQQASAIPHLSSVNDIHIQTSLAPLAKSINSAGFFQNIGYNVDFLVGYQHFFSRHFGLSVHASLGYGYTQSPSFNNTPFKSLQDVQIGFGGNLLYDFNAPSNYEAPLYYGIFAGVEGGNVNYALNVGNQALWRASYNLDVDFGLRFQFSSNILKWGVEIPLIRHDVSWQADPLDFQLDQSSRDIEFFITYEKIIF